MLELSDGYDKGEFVEKRALIFRVIRRFASLALSILKCRFIKAAVDISYGLGVLKEKLIPSYIDIPVVKNIETESDDKEKYPFRLFIHHVYLEE